MKTLRLLKLLSLFSVLMLAMAFSCQDHHVPDPDPVSNCNRIDGSPRAFPCEFEISKLEFLRNNTSQVVKTVLPGDTNVALPLNGALTSQYGSQRSYVIVEYKVRIHVKRIAGASFQPVGGYDLLEFRLSPVGPQYPPPRFTDVISPSGWPLPAIAPQNPVALDMPVGETRTFDRVVYMVFSLEPGLPQFFEEIYFSVVNNTAVGTLVAAPYNYNLLRDANEARFPFKPSVY